MFPSAFRYVTRKTGAERGVGFWQADGEWSGGITGLAPLPPDCVFNVSTCVRSGGMAHKMRKRRGVEIVAMPEGLMRYRHSRIVSLPHVGKAHQWRLRREYLWEMPEGQRAGV